MPLVVESSTANCSRRCRAARWALAWFSVQVDFSLPVVQANFLADVGEAVRPKISDIEPSSRHLALAVSLAPSRTAKVTVACASVDCEATLTP